MNFLQKAFTIPVAGIIGACTNNTLGVAGLTWNTKIMPIKVTNSSGSASYSAIANGITYAVGNGARIVSISIAGGMYSSTLQNAVDYAYHRGCLVVAVASNSTAPTVYYPAGCTNALAVGATDSNDQLYSYSNYGSALDVVAPGHAYTTARGGGYGWFGGTSCATPHISGAAALIASVNPQLSATDIANILIKTTGDLGTAGWDQYTGWGRTNAWKAIQFASCVNTNQWITRDIQQPPSVETISPTNNATASGIVTLSASAIDNVGVESLQFFVDGVSVSMTQNSDPINWDSRTVVNGQHTVTAVAIDAAGNSATSTPATIYVDNPVQYIQTFSRSVLAQKASKLHTWIACSELSVATKLSWTSNATLEPQVYNSAGILLASGRSTLSPLILDTVLLPAETYAFSVNAISGKARYQLTTNAQQP